jgi:hypothetical protein
VLTTPPLHLTATLNLGPSSTSQEKLADLAAAIGKIGFGVAVACFIALLIKW